MIDLKKNPDTPDTPIVQQRSPTVWESDFWTKGRSGALLMVLGVLLAWPGAPYAGWLVFIGILMMI